MEARLHMRCLERAAELCHVFSQPAGQPGAVAPVGIMNGAMFPVHSGAMCPNHSHAILTAGTVFGKLDCWWANAQQQIRQDGKGGMVDHYGIVWMSGVEP